LVMSVVATFKNYSVISWIPDYCQNGEPWQI